MSRKISETVVPVVVDRNHFVERFGILDVLPLLLEPADAARSILRSVQVSRILK